MFKKNQQIIISNRTSKELATVLRSYRRKDVHYYNIKTEKNIVFEGITEDTSYPVHVLVELSSKLNQNTLKPKSCA